MSSDDDKYNVLDEFPIGGGRELPDYDEAGLIKKLNEWLGENGYSVFSKYQKEFGEVSPVLPLDHEDNPLSGIAPHCVHFNEGMVVRNFLRGLDDTKDWDDHDYDNHWARLVTEAIK